MFSKIMVPVDLKHRDKMSRALSVAKTLANSDGAELHIVGVTMTSPTEVAANPEEFKEKLAAFAEESSREFGVPFEAHAEISHDMTIDLDDILKSTAEKIGADLIVMASHVPGLAEHVFASNAGYIASHVSMSVLVLR